MQLNKEFQQFFVNDRLKDLKRALDSVNPGTQQNMSTSIEPADGLGYCVCESCRKLGSPTDRTFTLANITAKAVAEKYPGNYVNIYAYGNNADVPTIPVEPNVYVLVIPYGFQRTGMSGDDLLERWAQKKKNNLGVYDYWAIPDWDLSLPPRMNYLKDVPEKIRFWHKQHV